MEKKNCCVPLAIGLIQVQLNIIYFSDYFKGVEPKESEKRKMKLTEDEKKELTTNYNIQKGLTWYIDKDELELLKLYSRLNLKGKELLLVDAYTCKDTYLKYKKSK